jgi:hypothetical protein
MSNNKQPSLSKIFFALTVAFSLGLSGCGGSSSSSTAASNTNADGETLSTVAAGYRIPTEISAVPADNGSTQARAARLFRSGAFAAVADLSADSDYVQAVPRRYVEEQSLEQFDTLEQVLSAIGQTHFGDAENINNGPYKAMVAWKEEQDGRETKQLQPWVVDSRMIVDDEGRDVNRVLIWIEAPDPMSDGGLELIKAEARVYESATVDVDGTITDYGEWELNVMFDDDVDDYFTASSTTENGVNVIKVHDNFKEGPPDAETIISMKGVLYRTETTGYGQVQYPDWESCWASFASTDGGEGDGEGEGGGEQSCVPESLTAKYAYNDTYMAVQQDSDPVAYKSREATTEMTHQYGLFYQLADAANNIAAGDNLAKHKSFGFPVTYTDSNGFTQFAYYGAWQGRHELWGGGPDGQITAGTTVTKEDFSGDTPITYTVSAAFNGTFTKRTLSDTDLNAIKGIPVETWVNDNFDLTYDAATLAWQYCGGYSDWSTWPSVCRDRVTDNQIALTDFTDFGSLVTSEGGRKWVGINRWDDNTNQNFEYVYLTSDPAITGFTFAGTGFYEAEFGFNGGRTAKSPAAKYSPLDGDNMWVNIGGSIYIQYTGDFTSGKTGWVEKQLDSFIEQTWTPVFADSSNDVNFSPDQGNEYYINNQGANYIVRRVDAADAFASYEVKSELQSTANPVNYATLLPTGTSYLRTPWRMDVQFTLVTDSADANFLKLIYKTDDPNTADVDESTTPTVYTSGEWGLQAYNVAGNPLTADGTAVTVDEWGFPDVGQPRPAEFNWEYSTGGWGTQQFLLDGNGDYVVLSDPVKLQPFTATNGAGDQQILSLQFDGWMQGLPDMYGELSKNNWVMTQDIADKIFNLPAGTEVTDTDGVAYYVKPLDISVFLGIVTEGEITGAGGTVPDITDASQADLATVPGFVPHGMGAMPTGTTVKYSEGIAVTAD